MYSMLTPRAVILFSSLVVIGLITGTIGQNTSTGDRQPGDELIYVQYKEGESLEPNRPSNITLKFSFDGGAAISTITSVEFFRYSDTISHAFVFQRGGAGVGYNYADFEYTAIDASYFRVQANYYGFRT